MATRVNISKDLEARLRTELKFPPEGGDNPERYGLLQEIVELLDGEQRKREAGASGPGKLGYAALVSLFRVHLGSDLALPPAPDTTWIIRMVAAARNMGVSSENVEQIVRGLRRAYPRGPYQLSFILGKADVHFANGKHLEGRAPTVNTGRPEEPV